jgi:hypothetical protein
MVAGPSELAVYADAVTKGLYYTGEMFCM